MGQVREVELTEQDITDAMIATEKEIAGGAWGDEETDALDDTGDRSLEEIGEGLEGQHEADEDEDDGDDAGDPSKEGDEESGDQGKTDESQPALAAKPEGQKQPEGKGEEGGPSGRVPAGLLREANERARAAVAERDAERVARAEEARKLAVLEAQMATLTQLLQGQRNPPAQPAGDAKPEPKSVPDIFENPQGFVEHITNQIRSEMGGVRQDLHRQSVENSFRIAHLRHGDAFPKAMESINRLDKNNPDDRAVVQRIYQSSDPGEALVAWHRRNETLARVGQDPDAYEKRIREETRKALMEDPEFKKQLLAAMRQEATLGDDGSPRTTTHLPRSLSRAPGSNLGMNRSVVMDGSEQAVADAAWN